MLRKALNISWREHVTNELLYGDGGAENAGVEKSGAMTDGEPSV